MIKNAHGRSLLAERSDDPTSAEFQKRYPNVAARDFRRKPEAGGGLDALVLYYLVSR